MEKKIETLLFLSFFATLMAPLSTEIAPSIKIYLFDFPLAAMYAMFFIRLCMHRIRLRFERFDLLFLLFYAWVVASSLQGKDFGVSVEWILYWLRGYLIIFYMRHYVGGVISNKMLFTAIAMCLLIEPALAILQTITQSSIGVVQQYFGALKTHHSGWVYEGYTVTRAQGTFMHTNFFGNWLIMLMPFLQTRLTGEQQTLRRSLVLWWLACLVALVLTLSRANWMAFVIGFFTVIICESRYRSVNVRKRKWLAYVVTPVIFMTMIYAVFTEELDYVAQIAVARAERTFEDKSSDLRTDLMLGAMEVLKGNLFMGVGSGNSNVVIHNSNPFIPDKFRATVHNIYLIVATENGVIGALLFILLLLTPFKRVMQALRLSKTRELSRQFVDNGIAFLACFTSLYFAMLWYVGMFHESEFPLIMTLLGAALGSSAHLMRQLQPARSAAGLQPSPSFFPAGARA